MNLRGSMIICNDTNIKHLISFSKDMVINY